MSGSELQQIYNRVVKHAEAATGPREDYLPTEEPSVMVNGIEVRFHLDNSPAIHYDVGDADDLVFVPNEEGKTPVVSAQEFVTRVQEIAKREAERYGL